MSRSRLAPAALALALLAAACTPGEAPVGPTPGPSASATATPTPTPAPTPSPSPWGDDRLPYAFPVELPLSAGDNAARVVTALHRAADGLPALKLDVTMSQATLTVLAGDERVLSYRWSDGAIDAVTADFQYLGQATFDPADYPLESIGRMFDVADLRGVQGDPIYQVQEYRLGVVFQTVSSIPESTIVFFRPDGSALPDLGTTTAVDIADGFAAVTHEAEEIFEFGLSSDRGYWATMPADDGRVRTRTRVGSVPAYDTEQASFDDPREFATELVDPAVVAMVLTRARTSPDDACSLVVNNALGRSAPVIQVTCNGETGYADLEGRDMTALIR